VTKTILAKTVIARVPTSNAEKREIRKTELHSICSGRDLRCYGPFKVD